MCSQTNRKKTFCYILLLICFFACTVCAGVKLSIPTLQDQDVNKEPLELHPIVAKMLFYMEVDNCSITALPQYDNISITLHTPTVLTSEVDQYVDTILQDWNQPFLSDAFVQENYNVDSISEFRERIVSIIMEQKKVELIANARSEVVNQLLSDSKFSMNEQAIAEYALQAIDFYEMDAYISNLSYDEYISQKYGSKQAFYESCYQDACTEVEKYLLIGAIAYNEELIAEISQIERTEEEVYMMYQELENAFFSLFITADENF